MKAVCPICPRACLLEEGQTGFCRGRKNIGGEVLPVNYGRITSLALDPVEKKPLRRFHPGKKVLSLGLFGCNLRCPFCQNHEISMAGEEFPNPYGASPDALAEKALELVPRGNIGIAYTYNEPLIGYEFVRDTGRLVREKGLKNVLVTNGYINEKPWRELLPLIDAANIDLKGYTESWYKRLGGDLETVKRSISLAAGSIHTEVTTLLVPGENDSEEEMRAMCSWLSSLRRDIPLHLSRFFPRYRMTDKEPTPVEKVYKLAETAREYLDYVYTGNC